MKHMKLLWLMFLLPLIAATPLAAVCAGPAFAGDATLDKWNARTNLVREAVVFADFRFENVNATNGLPRVLVIGDSIVGNYFSDTAKALEGKANCVQLKVSRCVGDPVLLKEAALAFGQYPFNVIHFNNGLHGWKTSEEEYASYLEDFVLFLKRYQPDAKLVWSRITPSKACAGGGADPSGRDPRIVKRNELADSIMNKHGVLVTDLNSIPMGHPEWYSDMAHFNSEGRKKLAEAVVKSIMKVLHTKTAGGQHPCVVPVLGTDPLTEKWASRTVIPREDIEWESFWVENANIDKCPRNALFIGDSVLGNYYNQVAEALRGKVRCLRLLSSRFVGDPMLLEETRLAFSLIDFQTIVVNNGLHGYDGTTEDGYAKDLAEYIDFIRRLNPSAKVVWVRTTPMTPKFKAYAERKDRLDKRNEIADAIMLARGIPAIDLHAIAAAHPDYYSWDGIHFNELGGKAFAKPVTAAVLNSFGLKTGSK